MDGSVEWEGIGPAGEEAFMDLDATFGTSPGLTRASPPTGRKNRNRDTIDENKTQSAS